MVYVAGFVRRWVCTRVLLLKFAVMRFADVLGAAKVTENNRLPRREKNYTIGYPALTCSYLVHPEDS